MHSVNALFSDSKHAGLAVSELKEKGYAESMSVLAKDEETGETKLHNVEQDVTDGIVSGAAAGAGIGTITALLAGATSLAIPGVGLVAIGPLATALAAAGAGAATGGVVGALVDQGIAEDDAKEFEQAVSRGEVLVSVTPDHEKENAVVAILSKHGADEVVQTHE